ncbi:MAG: SBBP repeat-containing protein [Candidatus Thorarchaeota archaeon]|jgi:hypothetical protein
MNKRGICLAAAALLLFVLSPLTVTADFRGNVVAYDENSTKTATRTASVFYENAGQIPNTDILFYGMTPVGLVGFTENEVHLWDADNQDHKSLEFEKASSSTPRGLEKNKYYANYFLGDRGTFLNVETFTIVMYHDLWPGIDIQFQTTDRGVEYKLTAETLSDQSSIQIKSDGFPGSEMFSSLDSVQSLPMVARGMLCEVTSLDYSASQTDGEDLLFSLLVGGGERDEATDVAIDSSGNLYMTGTTSSPDFPTLNALFENSTSQDCFVLKMDSTGEPLFSTFIGGSNTTLRFQTPDDIGNGIAVDTTGNIYVAGNTRSDNFPTVNELYSVSDNHDQLRGNYSDDTGDIFVLKLNPSGSSLVYSTYFGGTEGEEALDVAVDSEGNAFVTGITKSVDFPLVNEFDGENPNSFEAFVFGISTTGDEILYSSFIGGSSSDSGLAIAVDTFNDVYVTGSTLSSDIVPLVNSFDSSYNGDRDCFIAKITQEGVVVYSTYFGGSEFDQARAIAVDDYGFAYITGRTQSANLPTERALNDTYGGMDDCFVVKFSQAGNAILLSTYIGGARSDYGTGIDVDDNDNIYVVGTTASSLFPTTRNGFGRVHAGLNDIFVLKLNSSGNGLLYSTYIGGTDHDYSSSLVVNSTGDAFVVGYTRSEGFPTSPESTLAGGYDCFVLGLRIVDEPLPTTGPTTPEGGYELFMILGVGSAVIFVYVLARFIRKARKERSESAYELAMDIASEPFMPGG